MKLFEPEPLGCGGRSVVVGIKLDSRSTDLLTWALVKVAQPGDVVIALHVLANDEIIDRNGKSSLLSIAKAFDSVLAVYEGFCNLRQVELKLKICRGQSARKVIVREANSYKATSVIVGTSRNHHKIRSSTSVAKYCGKKTFNYCWVLAVNDGKVVFEREGSTASIYDFQGIEEFRGNGWLGSLHRSLNKGNDVLNEGDNATVFGKGNDDLRKKNLIVKQNCIICSRSSASRRKTISDGGERDNSFSIVQVQQLKTEEVPTSIRMLVKDLPELTPGWPLLRHSDRSLDRNVSSGSSGRNMSVVQWAMKLPGRCPYSAILNQNQTSSDLLLKLDRRSRVIVPVDSELLSSLPLPDDRKHYLPKDLEDLREKHSSTCRLFNYHELVRATSNFSADNLIGKGGSSQVYRGCLPDGRDIAVKILKPSEDVLKEFVLEIEIMTALKHMNIISLFGFCFESNNLLLVYDFISRGSLQENLHGNKNNSTAFGWNERFKVAVGVAKALNYLHNDSTRPVLHRDVKSSNVLLSDDFEPQLSDFGLAKSAPTSSAHIICSDVAGTFGYLAPEYFTYGKVNDKVDVYAFGVVLLELLSGRKPICSESPKGQESLVMWARPIISRGKVHQLLDPRLRGNHDKDQMERLILAASLCIRRAPRARPRMNLVLKLLQGNGEVTKWARLQVNSVEESKMVEEETFPQSHLKSHLSLALLDVEDDSLSLSSIEQTITLEDYLKGRWRRSSSFD